MSFIGAIFVLIPVGSLIGYTAAGLELTGLGIAVLVLGLCQAVIAVRAHRAGNLAVGSTWRAGKGS